MNWLALVLKIFSLTPFVVQEVEKIHGELPGASKKQIAMDALSAATNVALTVAPSNVDPAVNAASKLASGVIDGTVDLLNATGAMKSAQKPAPNPQAIAQAAAAAAGSSPAPAPAASDDPSAAQPAQQVPVLHGN